MQPVVEIKKTGGWKFLTKTQTLQKEELEMMDDLIQCAVKQCVSKLHLMVPMCGHVK